MELIHTASRQLGNALSQIDMTGLVPILAVLGVVGLGAWLLARRRRNNRA